MKKKRKKRILIWSCLLVFVGIGVSYFLSNAGNAETVGELPTPLGFHRVKAEEGSFAAYIRDLPLKPRGSKVQLYTGGDANYQFLSAAVVDKPLLSNAEQCADVTMHLRAEHLWKQGRYSEIRFTDVNGKRMQYSGGASKQALESYLRNVFAWCSTFSVHRETTARNVKDVQPGDVLVYPARPGRKYGHAVLVADVAKCGPLRAILCIEGNTPARDMHVLRSRNPLNKYWTILLPTDGATRVGPFHFKKDELRHY